MTSPGLFTTTSTRCDRWPASGSGFTVLLGEVVLNALDVLAQKQAQLREISRRDRVPDLAVLREGAHGQTLVVRQPLPQRGKAPVHRGEIGRFQHLALRGLEEGKMQFRVECLVDRAVHAVADRLHLRDDLGDALGERSRIALKPQAGGLEFERDAQLAQRPHAIEVQIHHEHAALRNDPEQPLRLQLHQGRAHRRLGDAVELRQLVLGEPLAEGERAGDDVGAQARQHDVVQTLGALDRRDVPARAAIGQCAGQIHHLLIAFGSVLRRSRNRDESWCLVWEPCPFSHPSRIRFQLRFLPHRRPLLPSGRGC